MPAKSKVCGEDENCKVGDAPSMYKSVKPLKSNAKVLNVVTLEGITILFNSEQPAKEL